MIPAIPPLSIFGSRLCEWVAKERKGRDRENNVIITAVETGPTEAHVEVSH